MAGTNKLQISDLYSKLDFSSVKLKRMVLALCNRFAIKGADISIVVVDDKFIKKTNKEFLGRTSVTDVISFDLSEDKKEYVYELVINGQLALREAKKRRHSPEAELALYAVHGFLHNVGYDDAKKTDSQKMHKMEDKILEEFGYGITFGQNTSTGGTARRE